MKALGIGVPHPPTEPVAALSLHGVPDVTNAPFKYFGGLKFLEMGDCVNVTDDAAESLGDLQVLFIGRCPLITNRFFAPLKSLELLALHGDQYDDETLKSVDFPPVTRLSIAYSDIISDVGIARLRRPLQALDVTSCPKVTGTSFASHPTLVDLDAMDCTLVPDALHGLTKLRKLRVSGQSINDASLEGLSKVTELRLEDCNVTGRAFRDMPDLHKLHVDKCPIDTDELKRVTQLKSVFMAESGHHTEALAAMPQLERLTIFRTTIPAALRLASLRELYLCRCTLPTDAFAGLVALRELSVVGCDIDPAAFGLVTKETHPELRKVRVRCCKGVTREHLEPIAAFVGSANVHYRVHPDGEGVRK